uniref:Uncharacterized protein n=1 Tax=Arundo donax TaxID=35708 RepID=A0A0A9APH8_ARUDO
MSSKCWIGLFVEIKAAHLSLMVFLADGIFQNKPGGGGSHSV